MLATKSTRVPSGPAWLHEVKWDGMRVLVELRDGRLRLWSRNEKDVTVTFPELHALAGFGRDVLLDGEVVAFLDGLPVFGALADRMHVGNPRRAAALAEVNPVTLLLFDVLRLDGTDLTGRPLSERRGMLEELGLVDVHWQVPATYDDGEMLLEATKQQRLEGIVSKKRDSLYLPGRRTADWLKQPHRRVESYVVGGWRPQMGTTATPGSLLVGLPDDEGGLGFLGRVGSGIGPTTAQELTRLLTPLARAASPFRDPLPRADALGARWMEPRVLVGEPTEDGLLYRGRVGSGIAGKEGQRLLGVLERFHTDVSPFADDVPRVDATGTTWVRPEVVVDIAALGLTPGKRLRQPSYRGVRSDLTPDDLAE